MRKERFVEQTDEAGNRFIDMTPTWQEILPTWKMIVADATKVLKPDQMSRFWDQMRTMAEAADKWNAHCEDQPS